METKAELKKVNAIVLEILDRDIRSRNDDKYLTYMVMRRFTKIYIPFEDFSKIPAFETIKRCRAKIQNKLNLYPPTEPEVIKKRSAREKVFREVMK